MQHSSSHRLNGSVLKLKSNTRKAIFLILVILCLTPYVSPPLALLLGFAVAQFLGHPYLHLNNKATHILLQVSVVGLGFGMNLQSAFNAGRQGILFTIVSISGTFILGLIVSSFMKIEKKTSFMIAAGTAICGGSAIAAVSPVIKANENQTSVALGVIFILNAVALFLFPYIGHVLHLSDTEFGMWCAIAIHDTSSVVGAAAKFGNRALELATTVKLARALWIIPVSFIAAFLFKSKGVKIKIPYFIGLFVIAMVANTYMPFVQKISPYVINISKSGLTLTLFLIGCGLSWKVIKAVGAKPLLQGILLWAIISITSLLVIRITI